MPRRPDIAPYRDAIRAAFPDVRVERCTYLAEGWDSVAVEVDGALVFRFPKRAEVAEWLAWEIRLTAALGPVLPVPIPRFTHVAPAAGGRLPFAGYPKLGGVRLDRAPELLDDHPALGAQLAAFLTALHRFPRERAVACGVPDTTWPGWVARWEALRDEVMPAADPLLTVAERAAAARRWAAFLAELRARDVAVTPVHHDLAAEHVLVAPDGARVTGVIDWGDAMIGDPALDFAGFFALGGAALVARLLVGYDRDADDRLPARAAWYARLGPFHELRFGLREHLPEHVAAGLAGIRQLLGGADRDATR
ncbi:MAG TPA: aminoglycoside phosphotransferase family protein [Thermomicrobiales bacterium]|nr:aminoglycoside phosphotransferase family protein [Thermomicrobiales bacterium]